MHITMQGNYQTRGTKEYPSRPVRILCVDGPYSTYPVIGIIEGDDLVSEWSVCGNFLYSDSAICSRDLIPVPSKRQGWIIISKGESNAILTRVVYGSLHEAEKCRTATAYPEIWIVVPITWEE